MSGYLNWRSRGFFMAVVAAAISSSTNALILLPLFLLLWSALEGGLWIFPR
jgi:hypothetical protein